MGEGDQGQKCGREEECLAAVEREVEVEEEVGVDSSSEVESSFSFPFGWGSTATAGSTTTTATASIMGTVAEQGPAAGYLRQEIIGIGGSLMRKVKKRVRIGATVWEFDDERDSGKYLEREVSGKQRSWCGWCRRVILSERDRKEEFPEQQ